MTVLDIIVTTFELAAALLLAAAAGFAGAMVDVAVGVGAAGVVLIVESAAFAAIGRRRGRGLVDAGGIE